MSQTMGSGLVASAEEQYNKLNLPSLPPSVHELLVTFVPWISLAGGILGLITFIPGTLVLLALSPLAGLGGGGIGYVAMIINLILSIVGAVLCLIAFNGLRKRTLSGWTFLFWASVVYVVSGLLPLSVSGLISAIFGAAVSMYLLFQIKPFYDGSRTLASAAAAPPAASGTSTVPPSAA